MYIQDGCYVLFLFSTLLYNVITDTYVAYSSTEISAGPIRTYTPILTKIDQGSNSLL